MQNPANLRVMAKAEDLAVLIYAETRSFPSDERFGLVSQIRRATVSIGANIAEGCGRRGNPELTAFLQIAVGSAHELEFLLRLAHRLGLFSKEQFARVNSEATALKKGLVKLVAYLRRQAKKRS